MIHIDLNEKETNNDLEDLLNSSIIDDDVEVKEEIEEIQEEIYQENNYFVLNKREETNSEKFLKNLNFDLSSIEFVQNNDIISAQDSIDFVLNGSGTYQIPAPQSCYIAFVESLTNGDISSITNSTLDEFNTRRKMYQLVWSKINTTNIGKLKFEDFLKITSFFDFPSLLYGVYVQTFPGKTEFNVTCGKCGGNSTIELDNDALIGTRTNELRDLFEKISKEVKTPQDVLNNSLISKRKRIILPDSKIVIDIKIPTLNDYLTILGSIKNREKAGEMVDIINTLIFLDNMYCMDVRATQQNHKPVYFSIQERHRQVSTLAHISLNDFKKLNQEIVDQTQKYLMEYKIHSFKCPKCGKQTGDISIDIEQLLFQEISR